MTNVTPLRAANTAEQQVNFAKEASAIVKAIQERAIAIANEISNSPDPIGVVRRNKDRIDQLLIDIEASRPRVSGLIDQIDEPYRSQMRDVFHQTFNQMERDAQSVLSQLNVKRPKYQAPPEKKPHVMDWGHPVGATVGIIGLIGLIIMFIAQGTSGMKPYGWAGIHNGKISHGVGVRTGGGHHHRN